MKKLFPIIIILLIFVGAYYGIKSYASNTAEKEIDVFLEEAKEFADIKYDDVEIEPLSQSLSLKNVSVSPNNSNDEIKAREIIVKDVDTNTKQGEIPQKLDIEFKGLLIDNSYVGKEDLQLLEDLGYDIDKVEMDLKVDYDYNKNDKELKINNLTASIDEMFDVELNAHISGINIDPKNPEMSAMSMAFASLHNFSLSFKDDSFVDRIFEQSAKQKGVSVAEMKADAKKEIKQMLADAEGNQLKQILSKIEKFIQNTDDISISASPRKPVNFGVIGMNNGNPAKIIEDLNIVVE